MNDNSIELLTVKPKEKSYSTDLTLEIMGHRSGVRALALSEDDALLVSGSSGKLSKVESTRLYM